jgi:hypothetical protein
MMVIAKSRRNTDEPSPLSTRRSRLVRWKLLHKPSKNPPIIDLRDSDVSFHLSRARRSCIGIRLRSSSAPFPPRILNRRRRSPREYTTCY